MFEVLSPPSYFTTSTFSQFGPDLEFVDINWWRDTIQLLESEAHPHFETIVAKIFFLLNFYNNNNKELVSEVYEYVSDQCGSKVANLCIWIPVCLSQNINKLKTHEIIRENRYLFCGLLKLFYHLFGRIWKTDIRRVMFDHDSTYELWAELPLQEQLQRIRQSDATISPVVIEDVIAQGEDVKVWEKQQCLWWAALRSRYDTLRKWVQEGEKDNSPRNFEESNENQIWNAFFELVQELVKVGPAVSEEELEKIFTKIVSQFEI